MELRRSMKRRVEASRMVDFTGALLAMGGYTLVTAGGFTASGGFGFGVAGSSRSGVAPTAGLRANLGYAF
jgi:hypothetical protein